MKLTEKSVAALKPRAERYEISDDGQPNLRVTIHPTGRRAFIVRKRVGGKVRKVTLTATTLTDARKEAVAVLARLADGPVVKAAEPNRITIASAWKRFVKEHASRVSAAWRRDMEGYARREILPRFADRAVADLTGADVRGMLTEIAATRPTTANRVHETIRRFLRWCVAQEIVTANVAAFADNTDVRQEERARDRLFTDAEVSALLKGLSDAGFHPSIQAALMTLAYTFQRASVVRLACWDEIDLQAGVWTIPADRVGLKRKRGSRVGHTVYLPETVVDVLKAAPRYRNCNFVFSTDGRSPTTLGTKITARLEKTTGVKDATFHDWRRAAASHLAGKGVSVSVVERMLGHVRPTELKGAVRVYALHDQRDEQKAAWEAWADHLDRLAGHNVTRMEGAA